MLFWLHCIDEKHSISNVSEKFNLMDPVSFLPRAQIQQGAILCLWEPIGYKYTIEEDTFCFLFVENQRRQGI